MNSSTDRPAPKTPPLSCGCRREFPTLEALIAHRQRKEC